MKRKHVLLGIILCIGLFLRLFRLGCESLYSDELLTVLNSTGFYYYSSFSDKVAYFFHLDHFAPYFVFMGLWIKLFGASEIALRLPSAIAGFLSIYLLFLFGKQILGEKVAMLASYLFAVSTINIYYSQCARPYSIGVFFVLLSFIFLLKFVRENNNVMLGGYICSTICGLLLNIATVPILICHLFFALLLWKQYGKRVWLSKLIYGIGFVLLMYIPFLLIFVNPNLKYIDAVQAFSHVSFKTIMRYFIKFAGSTYTEFRVGSVTANPHLVIPSYVFASILFSFSLLGIFNLLVLGNKKERYESGALLSLWLVVPLVFPFIFSYFVTSIFGPIRYILHISCAYYLLISKGILSCRRNIKLLLVLFIVTMGLIFLHEYYKVEKRTNWRQVCNYIREHIGQDEHTAVEMKKSMKITYIINELLAYYSAPSLIGISIDENYRDILTTEMPDIKSPLKEKALYSIDEVRSNGLWFVVWHPLFTDRNDLETELMKDIKHAYMLKHIEDFPSVSVYYFRKKDVMR